MTLPRSHATELIDEEGHDPALLEHSLGQVAQVNRWLGGERALTVHLAPWIRRLPEARVLDVGTGDGGTLERVLEWAERKGAKWRGVGVDLGADTVRMASAREGVDAVRGDAIRLPFADAAFEVALCTLTLHHFREDQAEACIREMARVASSLVVVNDLERHRLNHLGARALAATVWRGNPLTRNDGPLSVLRSFTRGELMELGRRAGLASPEVHRHFPWRISLVGSP